MLKPSLRILVVEDDKTVAGMIKDVLESEHPGRWTVTLALNFEEAKEALDAATYDVILADVRLPNGDGRHLVEYASPIPVILMSAYAVPEALPKVRLWGHIHRLNQEVSEITDHARSEIQRTLRNGMSPR